MSSNNFIPRTDVEKARASALASLSLREHSSKELQEKLKRKGYEQNSIEIVIEECLQQNYLNDMRFAEIYWRNRAAKGYGPMKILMELKTKGISSMQAETACKQDELDFSDVIRKVYYKKYRNKPIDDFKDKMKRQNYLYRRGFDSELISEVVK